MMFPYMSTYMHLLAPQRRPADPWDHPTGTIPTGGGSLATQPWDVAGSEANLPNPTKPWLQRPGVGEGLLALGTSLLESAPRNDLAGGLARGAAGFGQAMGAAREQTQREEMQAHELERQRTADARAATQEQDRHRGFEQDYDKGTAEMEAFRRRQDQDAEKRTATGKSAEQMVAEIQSLATANPADTKLRVMAKRAAAYALGGESDLGKLADLHEQMTGEAYRDQDADWKTRASIKSEREQIAAGVKVNPTEQQRVENRRADESLGISRAHLAISRDNAGKEKESMTDLQAYDRLEKKAGALFDQRINAYYQQNGKYPLPAVQEQWKEEARTRALRELNQGMSSVMHYTRDGRFVPGAVDPP